MDLTIEIVVAFFLIMQGVGAWVNARKLKTTEELSLMANLNKTIEFLRDRVTALETKAGERERELNLLRPLAIQVPLLKAQADALQKSFADCMEKQKDKLHGNV